MDVEVYDTTLRDGTQGEGLQLSVAEKVAVTRLLDDLGVAYIEGGWPGSNPRDEAYFAEVRALNLANARVAAFGSTRRAKLSCDSDSNIQALLRANAPVVTVFGKSWKFHATDALGISPEENLELIEDTIRYLKARVGEVIFDAEHFFDGYKDDTEYSLKALAAAAQGGADWLVLCDTNGGTLVHEVEDAVKVVRARIQTRLGVHTHNDADLAVANSLAAVRAGATMVQGTINGFGERCGNANLVSIIPALELKMGQRCLPEGKLRSLTHIAHTVDEITNRNPTRTQPYVGQSAFAHKGGVHVSAVMKNSRTYEHMDPELVGNRRRILVSDLSGRANVLLKAKEQGIDLDPNQPHTQKILDRLKELEHQGYQFEGAEASFGLVVDDALGRRKKYFSLHDLHATVHMEGEERAEAAKAIAKVRLQINGQVVETSAEGNGPVHAIDAALRKLLDGFYPALKKVQLLDYKVRVLSVRGGTGSVVRVLVQSGDGQETWGTVGVSPNIIEASYQAIVDALEYKLAKEEVPSQRVV